MDKKKVKLLLSCITKSAFENMSEILEKIPTVGGVLSESYKAVLKGVRDYQQHQTAEQEAKLKKQCYDLIIKEAKADQKPKYMSCVLFPCKDGASLSEEQQEILDCLFNGDIEGGENLSDDVESLGVIVDFTDVYFGGGMSCGEDYEIGDNYISFNFFMDMLDDDEVGYVYDEEPMIALANALNSILEQNIFKDYIIYGQDE